VEVLVVGQRRKAKVEIQLRTVAEDLFGTLSRRDVYKLSTKLPEPWLTKMKELGDRLKEVDKLAEELKQEWIKGNIKTKAKDQLDAQAIIRICYERFGKQMNINDAMNCLANLIKNDITKISELEQTLKDEEALAEIDKIYLELLGRKTDINGKVIYGSFLHKHKTFGEGSRVFLLSLIRNSIKDSTEYLEKMYKEEAVLGKYKKSK
jgi:hypothetical protein